MMNYALKHLLLGITVGWWLTGFCSAQQKNTFIVEGTVYNTPAQKVYLAKYGIRVSRIDSAVIDSIHNTFTLHGSDHEESHYVLWFEKSGIGVNLALGSKNEKMTLTHKISYDYRSRAEMMRGLTLEGNEPSNDLLKFDTTISNYWNAARRISSTIESLKLVSGNEQKIRNLKSQLFILLAETFDYSENFAKRTSSPVCAMKGVIDCIITEEDYPEINRGGQLKQLANYVKSRFPGSAPIKIALLEYKSNENSKKNIPTPSSLIGKKMPKITLADTSGSAISSVIPGKYVLVDFWASWCKPCRQESPFLIGASRKFKDKNFAIYSVSIDENRDLWLKAIRKDNVGGWTHVIDTKAWKSEYLKMYGITAIPANFLIDPAGKVIALDLRGDQLDKKLEFVFKMSNRTK